MKGNGGKKVLICMSGGVDSSVAAALLVRAGYDVTGAFMVNYRDEDKKNKECWVNEYRDAVRVAAHLGIPIIRLDFTREYKKNVLDYLYREYRLGRTPNPDVLCNQYIKFGVWLARAQKLGFDFMATGHYARLNLKSKIKNHKSIIQNHKSEIRNLECSRDTKKDQTYFLHQLNQEQLAHVLFPIGKYTKKEVRAMAKKFKIPTANKAESMGICFVGEVPMKEFLQKKIKTNKGPIFFDGKKTGEHDGLAFYTIGERHHGDAPGNEALYVAAKNKKKNALFLATKNDPALNPKEITVGEINWIRGQEPVFPLHCRVKIRHGQNAHRAVMQNNSRIIFQKSVWAPAPGQFAVIYKDCECLGGGVIRDKSSISRISK